MKSIFLLLALAVSINALAEENQLKQTLKVSLVSFSSSGLIELSDNSFILATEVYDEETKDFKMVEQKITALINRYRLDDETFKLLLEAKKSGTKFKVTYDPTDIQEGEECGGYQEYAIQEKDYGSELYNACYIVNPKDIIFY